MGSFYRLLLIAAALLGGALPGLLSAAEKVSFQSYDASLYTELFGGKFKQSPRQVFGYLTLPGGKGKKAPVAVIVPGSGGYEQWMQTDVADVLVTRGVGAFIVDSYTPRGVTDTVANQFQVGIGSQILDALSAFSMLKQHPLVDGAKIAIVGFSRGGSVVLHTAEARLRRAVLGDESGFAAYVPMYPGCQGRWRNPTVSGAKVLFLLGERDDWVEPAQCIEHAKTLSDAKADVTVKVLPNGHHGWYTPTQGPRYLSRAQNFSRCLVHIEDDGSMTDAKTGQKSGSLTFAEWGRAVFSKCGTLGASFGGDTGVAQAANEEMHRFLRAAFGE